jgi:hypothetical protein
MRCCLILHCDSLELTSGGTRTSSPLSSTHIVKTQPLKLASAVQCVASYSYVFAISAINSLSEKIAIDVVRGCWLGQPTIKSGCAAWGRPQQAVQPAGGIRGVRNTGSMQELARSKVGTKAVVFHHLFASRQSKSSA